MKMKLKNGRMSSTTVSLNFIIVYLSGNRIKRECQIGIAQFGIKKGGIESDALDAYILRKSYRYQIGFTQFTFFGNISDWLKWYKYESNCLNSCESEKILANLHQMKFLKNFGMCQFGSTQVGF